MAASQKINLYQQQKFKQIHVGVPSDFKCSCENVRGVGTYVMLCVIIILSFYIDLLDNRCR